MTEPDRYAWQEKCLEFWDRNQYRGIVEAVTGAGKTILALKAIARLEEDLGRRVRVKIVVPSKSLLYQWMNTIKKERLETEFGGAVDKCLAAIGCRGGGRKDSDDRRYMIYVINSARYQLARAILSDLHAGESVFLIADECHHYASGENRRIFDFLPLLSEQPGGYYSLGLSATLQSTEADSLLAEALGKKIYNYSFGQALCSGTVCDFVIFQIAVSFMPDELEEYERLSENMQSVITQLYAGCPILRNPGIAFFPMIKQLADGRDGKLSKLAQIYLALVYQRKRVVCMAQNRISCAERLLELIGLENPCIVFGESIEQAELIYSRLQPVYGNKVGRYHSKMGDRANQNTLMRFRDGELRLLIACRALDEGVDLPDAAVGIILSGTAVERQRVQRLGRLLRNSDGKTLARLFYLFIKESREEKAYCAMHGERFRTVDLEYDDHGSVFCYPDHTLPADAGGDNAEQKVYNND